MCISNKRQLRTSLFDVCINMFFIMSVSLFLPTIISRFVISRIENFNSHRTNLTNLVRILLIFTGSWFRRSQISQMSQKFNFADREFGIVNLQDLRITYINAFSGTIFRLFVAVMILLFSYQVIHILEWYVNVIFASRLPLFYWRNLILTRLSCQ